MIKKWLGIKYICLAVSPNVKKYRPRVGSNHQPFG